MSDLYHLLAAFLQRTAADAVLAAIGAWHAGSGGGGVVAALS